MQILTSSPDSISYCRETCQGNTQWTPDECLELCLDYYDTHPLPSQPTYPVDYVMTFTQSTVPKHEQPNEELIKALRQSINYLKQDIPANFNTYCTNVASAGSFAVRDTDFDGVDQVLAEWNLDPRATDFLRNIKFADSASYHSLGYQLQNQDGAVEEYVASGTNTNGRIVLAHVHVRAWGHAIYQTDCVRHCHRRLFSKKCYTDCYNRAFTAQEL